MVAINDGNASNENASLQQAEVLFFAQPPNDLLPGALLNSAQPSHSTEKGFGGHRHLSASGSSGLQS